MVKKFKNVSKLVTILCVTVLGSSPVLSLAAELDNMNQLSKTEVALTDEVGAEEAVTEETQEIEESTPSQTIEEVPAEEIPFVSEEEMPILPDEGLQINDEQTEVSSEEIEVEENITEDKKQARGGLTIDAVNFPDANFRNYVSTNIDTDGDGALSAVEIANVTRIDASSLSITDITGIKHFTSLSDLNVSWNALTKLDVAGMSNLKRIFYNNNPSLATLDLRKCPALLYGFHSLRDEVVYISAGMLSFIGCSGNRRHTGNIVIDLAGYYTVNPDGSKSVDLTSVISGILIGEFERYIQPGYDPATKILTIPAGDVASDYQGGEKSSGVPFNWTFYTELAAVNSHIVSFDSQGGSIVEAQSVEDGKLAVEPTPPTMDGFDFAGWYADPETTIAADLTQPVIADITYYAKWEKKYTVIFESNGGSAVPDQMVMGGQLAVEPIPPTMDGYDFVGWYVDPETTIAADLTQPVIADITYYAKWGKKYTVVFESNGGSAVSSQTVKEGQPATQPAEPTKDGFVFLGWFSDQKLNQEWKFATIVSDFLNPPTATRTLRAVAATPETTLTLYAKWDPVEADVIGRDPIPPKSPQKTPTTSAKKSSALPKTGETVAMSSYQFGLMLIGMCLVSLYYRHKNKFNEL